MIFVTVGNHDQAFDRLIKRMDEIAGRIDEKVIMQTGHSHYRPVNAEYFQFTEDFENIKRLNSTARVVVSHAGAGSIITALQAGTPAIIVPRLKRFNEHFDDHQLEICEALCDNPRIKVIYDIDDLERTLGSIAGLKSEQHRVNDLSISLKRYFGQFLRGDSNSL